MGLDITAYENVEYVENCDMDADGYPTDESVQRAPFLNSAFPGREEGARELPFKVLGSELDFRAGSYGGYNRWRAGLAEFANTFTEEELKRRACSPNPFQELIQFSDCEGTIGPVVSEKLYRDFLAHEQAAKDLFDEWAFHSYRNWMEAFRLASNGGLVAFY